MRKVSSAIVLIRMYQKTEYIKSFMKANDLKTDIFVIRDWKNYLNRIRELEKWDRASCDEKLLKIEGVLRGIAI